MQHYYYPVSNFGLPVAQLVPTNNPLLYSWASLVAQMVKNLPTLWETWFDSWVGKIHWRRVWQPTPVYSMESMENPHGQRSLAAVATWPMGPQSQTQLSD